MTRHPFKSKYHNEILPLVAKSLGRKNVLAGPRLVAITVNVGTGKMPSDEKLRTEVAHVLSLITGQKPVITRARKAVAGFKTRQGQAIGLKVTIRGQRMLAFLEKFITIVLPRVRDFRGIPLESIDARGNLSVGIKENLVFPEVSKEHIRAMFGLEVTITTSARNREEGAALLKALGVPLTDMKT